MADISNPKEFLQEVLEAVDSLNADRAELKKCTENKDSSQKELNTLRINIEAEKEKTVELRRNDLGAEFDKKMKAIDAEVEKISNQRAKARTKAVKGRIADQTQGYKGEIAGYKAQLAAYCKENGLSPLCKTRLYYKLFCPGHITDWLILLVVAALMVGALIGTFKIHDTKLFIIAILIDVLIIALYAFIWSTTKGKHTNEVKYCKQIMDGIRKNEKDAGKVTKDIRRDKDDSPYELSEFDAQIAAKQQEKADIEMQKTNALYQFDTVTKQQLMDEIASAYSERLNNTYNAAEQAKTAFEEITKKTADSENAVSLNYVQYLGSKNLTHDAVTRMIELVESGEAASVSEAVSKLAEK
ncbi:MAG: hypothetical protein Q4E57_05215 [Eubacteriales bacterium]|nr:hypothetical protein [Eubacteriales bacterium]